MPPKGSKINTGREPSNIERTPEYEGFIKKLEDYHAKRGTTLDPEPKVGSHFINLLKLYERVLGEGGYDLCSDTKAKPLMWRKFAEEVLGKTPHLAAQAFQVKSAYYKNLALVYHFNMKAPPNVHDADLYRAYEISTHWKKEPPPKEILEDLTAKGGAIMERTVENFLASSGKEDKRAKGDSDSDDGDDTTPKHDKMDTDDPGSAPGRSTRGLRQAPPQRVLFQPDVNHARQTRNASNQLASPSPSTAAAVNGLAVTSYASGGLNTTLANYEPRQSYPLTLKPVTTPANSPDYYRNKRKQEQEASVSQIAKRFKGLMLPGTGFIGPNIYVRAQLALQSGLPEEEQYALHHLVKISHERGDKYRFDQFPGLAEALINKVLQISSLFYDIDWSVTYSDQLSEDVSVLHGLYGTPDVLKKLKARLHVDTDDHVQDADFSQSLGRVTEAALVIRNMVMLDENAQYVARIPLLKDFFCIVLGLEHPGVVECQHYALETAEQLSMYYHIGSKDPFYQALLAQLDGNDRGKIVTSLRALARLGMRYQENKRLEDVSDLALRNLAEWVMVEDEELRSACLDFLFQFTSVADNVSTLIQSLDVQALVRQLARLLLFNAKEDARKQRAQQKPEELPHPTQVPKLAKELVEQLLKHEEPERSSHWLRMCFQDDPTAEMTQIHLWQSYQGTFVPYAATHPHLIAGDFIKNVSNTFSGASAQVAGANKYVIRGIKPRLVPVDYRGRELSRCLWRVDSNGVTQEYSAIFAVTDGRECGEFFPSSAAMLEHILSSHLHLPRKRPTPPLPAAVTDAKSKSPLNISMRLFDFSAADPARKYDCQWSTCSHSASLIEASSSWVQRALLARHIETHLPDATATASLRNKHNAKADTSDKAPLETFLWLNTMTDERHDAAGVPLGASLVLRNIARGIAKLPPGPAVEEALKKLAPERKQSAEGAEKKQDEPSGSIVMKRIFDPVKDQIFFAMAHNHVLKDYLGSFLKAVAQGGG